uniref:Uncharacterized protein n=1 Tax=Rhizophora mucronata TaxID=61149 RepID=A0A2P2QQG2_RHIMU
MLRKRSFQLKHVEDWGPCAHTIS